MLLRHCVAGQQLTPTVFVPLLHYELGLVNTTSNRRGSHERTRCLKARMKSWMIFEDVVLAHFALRGSEAVWQ